MLVIVPNNLRDAIYEKLDEALKDHPEHSEQDREILYHELLEYFNGHGVIPEFKLQKN